MSTFLRPCGPQLEGYVYKFEHAKERSKFEVNKRTKGGGWAPPCEDASASRPESLNRVFGSKTHQATLNSPSLANRPIPSLPAVPLLSPPLAEGDGEESNGGGAEGWMEGSE
ncbi:hypothetical protein TNCT_474701 [Trichonephila clavata]|uniref:Uncharacterized protein n=1 Tax=Trichonephila clavata TaxID=2740835 RepID=A0A8X6KPV9_TRICU|nr:hypothetical protein TNCT_474701 [Trichonephila clavata]